MKKALLSLFFILAYLLTVTAEDKIKAVLFPFREAIIASRLESTLQPYRFRLGESFKQDALLTTLDDANYLLRLQQITAQMEFARATYEDKKELRAQNFTSDFELKKAEFDFRIAENARQAAELNFSYCRVKAPFPGKIVEIMTREYETVRPGQPLFRIIDDNSLLAVMNLPLHQLRPVNSKITLLLDNGTRVEGTVYEIFPQADHRTGTVRIRVKIPNHDGKLCAGMTGTLLNGK